MPGGGIQLPEFFVIPLHGLVGGQVGEGAKHDCSLWQGKGCNELVYHKVRSNVAKPGIGHVRGLSPRVFEHEVQQLVLEHAYAFAL